MVCRQEYLAIGEAPDQIRNCYQQRSRWCKGHFQIIFNKDHCPLTQRKLSVSCP
jgi:cellulose synthase/poly-beta-1,6-N-acetylglucosamine synthase-like glycosyltransferase